MELTVSSLGPHFSYTLPLNDGLMQEKTQGDSCRVCVQGHGGVSLAAHSINILQKTAENTFSISTRKSPLNNEAEVNQLLMRPHVPGARCENMLK